MFNTPGALFWLPPVLLVCAGFWFWASKRRARIARLLGEPETLSRLVPSESARRRRWKLGLRLSALACLILALAGPQWGVALIETQTEAVQAVIAVDVSASMTAEDVKPTRLEKAKGELSFLLDKLAGNRVGIIAFAGEAVSLCPLTMDIEAAKQILRSLEGSVPQPGSAVGKAIRAGVKALSRYPGGKALILLTDGEDHKSDPSSAAAEAAAQGIHIFAIGIGSPDGEPIPLRDSSGSVVGYKKDKKGNTVVSRLGENALREAARVTSGAYFRNSPGESEALEIARLVNGLEKTRGISGAQQYKNRYWIPLLAAFIFLLLEIALPERNKKIIPAAPALMLFLLTAAAGSVSAASSEGHLREGNRLYERQEYVPALEAYSRSNKKVPRDPRPVFNAGDTLYRLEEYDQAAKAFSALTNPEQPPGVRAGSFYNLGNIGMASGKYQEAIANYRQALVLSPQDSDIRHNLALALRYQKNPPPDKKKPPQPKNKKQDQKDKSGGEQPKKDPAESKPQEPRSRPQDQITKEDAERILRAQQEKEKSTQQNIQKRPTKSKTPEVEEDW